MKPGIMEKYVSILMTLGCAMTQCSLGLIDLGWDLDSVLTETANVLENDLYSAENPQYNFFYEIVNDAIGFIVSCLPAK